MVVQRAKISTERVDSTVFSILERKQKPVSGRRHENYEFVTLLETLEFEKGNRKFTGTVSATGLTLNEDGTKTTLKRGCANAYSDISAGTGGDYGGTEVYITDSGGSWFALVTIAEGVLRPPVLVKADVTG